ncbi:MAG: hypothetical protein WA144_02025 [Candidatus Methanoperedens sp.]
MILLALAGGQRKADGSGCGEDAGGKLFIGHRLSPPVIPEPMSTDMGIKCLT